MADPWRTAIPTTVGALLILVTLRDVVHELFHPDRTGSLSRAVTRWVWRALRALGKRHRGALYSAGPTILVAVAFTWTGLLLLGWALLYWPRLPQQFNPNPHLPPDATHGFLTAIYVSLASITTLSASDLTPQSWLMRLVVALESFVGPVLFTAWITWVLGIYPVIASRRAFAREVELLRRAQPDPDAAVRELPDGVLAGTLRSLTEQVLMMGAHLRQSRVTYYFQNDSVESTLTRQFPYALALGRAAESRGADPAARHHGAMLRMAVEMVLGEMGKQFLDMEHAPPERVLDAMAEDHLLSDVRATAEV